MCEKRNRITKIAASPKPRGILYMPAKIIKTIRNRLPKGVSNNLTNKLGTANMTNHNITNKLNKPTIKFLVFSSFKENAIIIIVYYTRKI